MKAPALLVVIVSSLASPDTPTEQRPRVTGFFSDLALSQQTGDLGGTEIFISYAQVNSGLDERYYAYIQLAEGVPMTPHLVPAHVEGANVEFTFAPFQDSLSFKGSVTRDFLIGRFSTGYEVRLPRRPTYWR